MEIMIYRSRSTACSNFGILDLVCCFVLAVIFPLGESSAITRKNLFVKERQTTR